ncbi:MAG: DUF87 domain-containing protein [Candidatus Thermoplasmatota archaeon]|jgi:hypothetical protein|nr:DUF87 domain-containing protein [Candidatus Thermoplasmatota archaeon]
MNLQKIQALAALANEAGLLDNDHVQNLLYAIGLDEDDELTSDAMEIFSAKALKKMISPDPFYPLPDGLEVAGDIELGKVGKSEFSFGLKYNEMAQHVLSVGRSGSGKTNQLFHVMNQLLKKNIPFWCFDFKREFRGLLRKREDVLVLTPENFKFNPLRPPEGITPLRWISIFSDVFAHSTGLLEGSNSFLLDQAYNLFDLFQVFDGRGNYPSFKELLEILKRVYVPLNTREARYLESVRNRLNSCVLNAESMLDCSKDMMDDLLKQNKTVVFEFYGLSEHVASFFIEMILTKLYFYRMAQGRGCSRNVPMVVFMDEARNVYDYRKEKNNAAGVPIIDTITERIRDFGVSLYICTQIPTEICASAKANTYTKIMMNLGNGNDIHDMARCMGLNENQMQFNYGLGIGNAIVRMAGRYTKPFWFHVPEATMDKDVSDWEVEHRTGPALSGFEVIPVARLSPFLDYVGSLQPRGKSSQSKNGTSSVVRDFMGNVACHPYHPATRRYDTLGLSRKKGKVVKDYLLENGLATELNVKVSKTIFNFLVLTQKGFATCIVNGQVNEDWKDIVSGKVSFLHKFYQFLIKEVLTQEGWDVFIEYKIKDDKWVDVVAKCGNRNLAFEVAITKFEPDDVLKCIADEKEKFDEIRVVCKDETTRKEIEELVLGSVGQKERELVIVQTISGLMSDMPKKP